MVKIKDPMCKTKTQCSQMNKYSLKIGLKMCRINNLQNRIDYSKVVFFKLLCVELKLQMEHFLVKRIYTYIHAHPHAHSLSVSYVDFLLLTLTFYQGLCNIYLKLTNEFCDSCLLIKMLKLNINVKGLPCRLIFCLVKMTQRILYFRSISIYLIMLKV